MQFLNMIPSSSSPLSVEITIILTRLEYFNEDEANIFTINVQSQTVGVPQYDEEIFPSVCIW